MSKVVILMMDSFGVGGAKDAYKFDDDGANTFLHIAENYEGFSVPNLEKLGLNKIEEMASGVKAPLSIGNSKLSVGSKYGCMEEKSAGKDTISGHWEMAGVPVLEDFGHFKLDYPSFPQDLVERICKRAGIDGILGNKAASGTVIIQELGEEHIKTGKPIWYTSADSNLQIACHEEYFGLDKLYKLCEIAFEEVKPYNIGRVIARPFVGQYPFMRTANRHDYSIEPSGTTMLDKIYESGKEVIALGKISDIFASRSISESILHESNFAGMKNLIKLLERDFNGLCFVNLVDFDSKYGHRNDIDGYAKAVSEFDEQLKEFLSGIKDDDVVIVTADHGCDPATPSTDHSREFVPLLVTGKKIKSGVNLGVRKSFADIAKTTLDYLGVDDSGIEGESFLPQIYGE